MVVIFRESGDILEQRHKNKGYHRAASLWVVGFAINALSLCACTPLKEYPAFVPPPSTSLTMGGYREDHDLALAPDDEAVQMQARNLQNTTELKAAIKLCHQKSAACNSRIKAFSDMIEQTSKIHDRLIQVLVINAWINARFKYDQNEALSDLDNLHDRTMVEAIEDELLICDEAAQLKLFALEALGFDSRTHISIVAESVYDHTSLAPCTRHFVVAVNLQGKMWVLTDNIPNAVGYPSPVTVLYHTLESSRIELAATQLNYSGNSAWNDGTFYVPEYEYNARQAAYYPEDPPSKSFSNVPAAALHAPKASLALNTATFQSIHAERIMASAFEPHQTLSLHRRFYPAAPGSGTGVSSTACTL